MRIHRKTLELNDIQEHILEAGATSDVLNKEKTIFFELMELLYNKESIIRQRSKIQWLKEGDLNTSFFQKMMRVRSKSQLISSLNDSEETIHSGHKQVIDHAVDYF